MLTMMHTTLIFTNRPVLKLNDLFKTKIMSLMWDFDHNILPACLNEFFVHTSQHRYNTRAMEERSIQINPNFNTANNKCFVYLGTKIFNEMQINPLYNPILYKKTFTLNVKNAFINNY